MAKAGVRPLLAFGLGVVLSNVGCTPTEWVPTRYGAPLSADHAANLETNCCAHECYQAAGEDTARFYRCLNTCPGITRMGASTCDDPAETEEAFCYTQWVEREVESTGRGSTAGDVLGALFQLAFEVLVESAKHEGQHASRERSYAERNEPPPARAEPRRRRSEERSEPRHYVPAKPHRR